MVMFVCHLVEENPLTSEDMLLPADTIEVIAWCHLALVQNLLQGCDDTLIC